MEKRYSVYKHTTPNNKVYIGITGIKPEYRWKKGYGYHNHSYFFNAIKKYGWDNIKHDILYIGLTKQEAEKIETELIAKYDSTNKTKGYNICLGGHIANNMYCHSVYQCTLQGEIIKKWRSVKEAGRELNIKSETITCALRGNKRNLTAGGYFWIYTDEKDFLIERIKYLNSRFKDGLKVHSIVGVSTSDNSKIYFRSCLEAEQYGYLQSGISNCLRGIRKQYKGYIWRLTNGEDEPIFDIAPKVKINKTNKNKPIIAINTKTNEIKEYQSTHEAEKDGFNRGNIKAVLNGRKLSHHGYKFMYKGE